MKPQNAQDLSTSNAITTRALLTYMRMQGLCSCTSIDDVADIADLKVMKNLAQ
jgi:hypothetical protein